MARSIDTRTGREEEEDEGAANIWTADEAMSATTGEIVDYITGKIDDYDEKGLQGIDLFEY
jgi:hypothetical protein